MADRFSIKKDATFPSIAYELLEDDGPKDVSSATVTFNSRLKATKTAHVSGGSAGYVTDGTDGKVQFGFNAAQTATPGIYEGEFVADFGTGIVGHWPSDGFIEFEIQDDI